jgi:hypothetical protein
VQATAAAGDGFEPRDGGHLGDAVCESVLPLINLMHEELLTQPFVQMDETYLQVVRTKSRALRITTWWRALQVRRTDASSSSTMSPRALSVL